MDLKQIILSWDEVSNLTNVIIEKMRYCYWKPDVVVGLTRGGLLPATLISHRLDIEMSSLDVSLRSDENRLIGNNSTWLPELINEGYKLLIVDDINDTGSTFNWITEDWRSSIRNMIQKNEWPYDLIKFSALIHNFPSSHRTDFFGMEINKDIEPSWIIFPWEK